jgi:hypothetical protein
MLVRGQNSTIRRNYGHGVAVRVGRPLLSRRATPPRASDHDASRGLALRVRRRRSWKTRIRSLIAELGLIAGPRPRRATG